MILVTNGQQIWRRKKWAKEGLNHINFKLYDQIRLNDKGWDSIAAIKGLIEENNENLKPNWRKILNIGEELQNN
jgi:hypothetical protein